MTGERMHVQGSSNDSDKSIQRLELCIASVSYELLPSELTNLLSSAPVAEMGDFVITRIALKNLENFFYHLLTPVCFCICFFFHETGKERRRDVKCPQSGVWLCRRISLPVLRLRTTALPNLQGYLCVLTDICPQLHKVT